MTPPIAELADLLTREPVNPLEAWLADSLRLWTDDGTGFPWHRFAGLGGPASFKLMLRDYHLLQAAALLPAPKPWKRASRLYEAVRDFELLRWGKWMRLPAPPRHATPVDVHLWHAQQIWGEPLPSTTEAYHQLLSKQDPTGA